MLIDGLIDLFKPLIDWIIGAVPQLPGLDQGPALGLLVAFGLMADNFLPLHEALACCGICLAMVFSFQAFKWVVKIVDYIAAIIP